MVRKILPKDDVWFWNGKMGRVEGDNSVGVGGRNGGEEARRVKRAGVEEVWGFCAMGEVSNAA